MATASIIVSKGIDHGNATGRRNATDGFRDAGQTRKSVRGFTKEPVSRAVIEDIIEVAQRAPSSMNTQPWHIHVLPWALPTTAFPPTPSAPTAR
jgi:hypothetical protein